MTNEDYFETGIPQKGSAFQNENSVEVKCEIYEPQVSAPTTVT